MPRALSLQLRLVRYLLRLLNGYAQTFPVEVEPEPFDSARLTAAESELRGLPMPDDDARAYLSKHIPRLARTLALVPEPGPTGRVLELGCYMQITPLLHRLCGYREVRGAYQGPVGRVDVKTMQFGNETFRCEVDHFDAERDRFPYPDGHFDLVIAGEIIEHLVSDPMHLLLESRRVLRENGYLLVTTPNVGSVTSVAKTLDGHDNPQIFFLYDRPMPDRLPNVGHVREYTAWELGDAVRAAGFEVNKLFTTHISEWATHLRLIRFLQVNGYSAEHRGEQTWCLATKRQQSPIDRYPWFIYNP
ncbi:MAG: methyltransferase domain-containing protein [Acidobacteriota bacterium]|nr:methyltransferase domain-containing protein [Acidobacteriota bacterium]